MSAYASNPSDSSAHRVATQTLQLFLCGDVMTGRGIDQILAHPVNPSLYEPYIQDARDYIKIAERANGPITYPVSDTYIWGEALEEFAQRQPDVKVINLETSVTTSPDYWEGKGIHYRMHPENAGCLTAAGIDCCVLANNHVLDWGYQGLSQTLKTLESAQVRTAGAGENRMQAEAPAIMEVEGKGRVLVFSYGSPTSGIPETWQAQENRSGVNVLADLSDEALDPIIQRIRAIKQPGDIVVFSVHWGGNWGYEIPAQQKVFAHKLIDQAGVDIIHGHSSHHVKGFEIYNGKPVFYGCGDFINDYEGIRSYEVYRGELSLMYFLTFSVGSGKLVKLELVPMRIKHFQLHRAGEEESRWLCAMLKRECGQLGVKIQLRSDWTFTAE